MKQPVDIVIVPLDRGMKAVIKDQASGRIIHEIVRSDVNDKGRMQKIADEWVDQSYYKIQSDS